MSVQKKYLVSNVHLHTNTKFNAAQGKSSNTPNEDASSSILSNNKSTNSFKRSLVDESINCDILKKIRHAENIENEQTEYTSFINLNIIEIDHNYSSIQKIDDITMKLQKYNNRHTLLKKPKPIILSDSVIKNKVEMIEIDPVRKDNDEPYDEELVNYIINVIQNLNKNNFSRFIEVFERTKELYNHLNSFIIQKIIRGFTEKGDLENIYNKIQLLVKRENMWRLKYAMLYNQLNKLKSMHEMLMSEITVDKFDKPHIIKRTVGTQVWQKPSSSKETNHVQLRDAAAQESVDIITISDDDAVIFRDTDIKKSTSKPFTSKTIETQLKDALPSKRSTSKTIKIIPKKVIRSTPSTTKTIQILPKTASISKPSTPKTIGTTPKKNTITSSSPVILKPSNVIHKRVGPPSSALDIANTNTKCNIHLTGSDDLIDVTNGLNIEHPPNNIVNYSSINTQISAGTSSQQLQNDLTTQKDLSSVEFIEPSQLPQTASNYMVVTSSTTGLTQLIPTPIDLSKPVNPFIIWDGLLLPIQIDNPASTAPITLHQLPRLQLDRPLPPVPPAIPIVNETNHIQLRDVAAQESVDIITISDDDAVVFRDMDIKKSTSKPFTSKTIETRLKDALPSKRSTSKSIKIIPKKVIKSIPSTTKTIQILPKTASISKPSTTKTIRTPKKRPNHVQLPNAAAQESVNNTIIDDVIFLNTNKNESISKPSSSKITESLPNKHPANLPTNLIQNSFPGWKKIPPAPKLSLFLFTKNSKALRLSWNMNLSSLIADISFYEIYFYREDATEVPREELWNRIGVLNAFRLPMSCTLSKLSSGENYYFAVRAVDIHARVGPFSEPKSVYII